MLKLIAFAVSVLSSATIFASEVPILHWHSKLIDEDSKTPRCLVGRSGGKNRFAQQGIYFTYVRDISGRETWSARVGLYENQHAKSLQYIAIEGKEFTKRDGYFTPEESSIIANMMRRSSKFDYKYSGTDSETGKTVSFNGHHWIGLFDREVRACRTWLERR